jgi:hypothetical protein
VKKPVFSTGLRRRLTSLLIAFSFAVLAVTGVLAFARPFSLPVVGLHAVIGFLFIILAGIHIINNLRPLQRYLQSRSMWVILFLMIGLTCVIFQQSAPVKSLLRLSANLGPALERFEMGDNNEMVFHYTPAPSYQMKLTIKLGNSYQAEHPPIIAIWLENQGVFHIKTLLEPDSSATELLPYWSFKRDGWEKAKKQAEAASGQHIISEATPNGSFDPADYILPADPDNPMPYRLLVEVYQPRHPSASLIYAVEIDNSDPRAFQLLDLVGTPKREDQHDGKEAWSLYYVDDTFAPALELINSALLTIERRP